MRILAVTNIYPTPERPHMGTFVEQQVVGLRRAGLEVAVMLVDRAKDGTAVYRRLRSELESKLASEKPDLVHVMYGGVMADIVTRTVKHCPVIVSFCGSDLLGERLPGFFRRLMVRYGVVASCRAARRAHGIVVKSRNLREALPPGIPSERIRIIPNGVDLERFQPMPADECRRRLGWKPGRFHILFPANTGTPRKRPALARAAVAVAKAQGVDAELHFLQGVRHEDVPVWLNASSAVLLTSEHEGSPNIIKEALACDRPVVSVEVGDVAERLKGLAGCHVVEPDAESLGALLVEVAGGPGHVEGRSRMRDLSIESVAWRLREFYECTMARRRGFPVAT